MTISETSQEHGPFHHGADRCNAWAIRYCNVSPSRASHAFQLGEHPCALLNARAFGKLKFAGEFFIGRAVPDQRIHEVVSSLACRASRALLALRM